MIALVGWSKNPGGSSRLGMTGLTTLNGEAKDKEYAATAMRPNFKFGLIIDNLVEV